MFVNASTCVHLIGSPGTTVPLPVPAGVVDGDQLLMIPFSTVGGVPAGWIDQGDIFGGSVFFYSRIANSEPASYLQTSAGDDFGAIMLAYRNSVIIPAVGTRRQVDGANGTTGVHISTDAVGVNPITPCTILYVGFSAGTALTLNDRTTLSFTTDKSPRAFQFGQADAGYPLPNLCTWGLIVDDELVGAIPGEPGWTFQLDDQPAPGNPFAHRMRVVQLFELSAPATAEPGFGLIASAPGYGE